MDTFTILIISFVAVLTISFLAKMIAAAPGIGLADRFYKLKQGANGNLAGKTYGEIKAACGEPTSVSYDRAGGMVCQWMAGGYHIVLEFDRNHICTGISHEATVNY